MNKHTIDIVNPKAPTIGDDTESFLGCVLLKSAGVAFGWIQMILGALSIYALIAGEKFIFQKTTRKMTKLFNIRISINELHCITLNS